MNRNATQRTSTPPASLSHHQSLSAIVASPQLPTRQTALVAGCYSHPTTTTTTTTSGQTPHPSETPGMAREPSTSTPTNTETIRLHITPLTPSTLTSLIPASIIDSTVRESLSYHSIPTFPENSYAFLTLPVAKAEALKKKLNGSTFRGVKVRVEEARPEKEADMGDGGEKSRKEVKAERKEKRKREDGEVKVKKRKKGEDKEVIEGVQLPEGRKVARGWTAPEQAPTSKKYAGKSASSSKKSEDDSKRECLFKTPLPPNKVSTKEKKKDEDKKDKKKRKREVVVKEFKNNTKFPQFLRVAQLGNTAADAMASEYVDGVGWVNGKGELVEEEKIKRRAADIVQAEVETPETTDIPEPVKALEPEDDVKSTVSFSDEDEAMVDVDSRKDAVSAYVSESSESELEVESEPESEDESKDIPTRATKTKTSTATAPVSNSESSEAESDLESDESESDPESDSESKPATPPATTTKPSPIATAPLTPVTPVSIPHRTISNSSSKNNTPTLRVTIPTFPSPSTTEVHPLEALYKPTARQTILQVGVTASPSVGETSAFKFGFGAADDSDSDQEPVVQTPYRERYRSAAPTPDTAIGHRKFFPDDSEDSTYHGKLGFVPSTPKVAGFSRGDDVFTRGGAAAESPLLFPHSESRFLGALSVWSKLPTPKAFTPEEPSLEEVDETTVTEKKDKKKKKAKGKKVEEEEVGEVGEKTPAEVWSDKFYEKRGEWNRAWKGRRREVLKAKRKREAAAGPGKRVTA